MLLDGEGNRSHKGLFYLAEDASPDDLVVKAHYCKSDLQEENAKTSAATLKKRVKRKMFKINYTAKKANSTVI